MLHGMTWKEDIVAKIISPIRNSIICKLPIKAFLEMTQNADSATFYLVGIVITKQ